MKFTIESENLKQASTWTRAIAESIQTDRILGCVLLETEDSKVTFRSTDRHMEVECRMQAMTEQEGGATVSAKTLNDLARRMPDGSQLVFAHDPERLQLEILSNRTNARLPTFSRSAFPRMASEDYTGTFEIGSDQLKRLFEKSRTAACLDTTREYLCGLNLHVVDLGNERFLRCVATDGFMMAIVDQPAPEGLREMPTTVIPSKAAAEAIKIFTNSDEPVEVSFSEGKIRFKNRTASLASRLLNGKDYPNYPKLIPRENPLRLRADARSLKETLQRVAVVADRLERKVTFAISNGDLSVTVQDPALGLVTDQLPVDYPHPDFKIGFRLSHLLGFLDQIGDGQMEMRFKEASSAVRVTSESDQHVLYLLMPMAV